MFPAMPAAAIPAVAPFEPCVVCFKGDTNTVVSAQGSPEWHAMILQKLGLPADEAMGTFEAASEQFGGIPDDEPVTHRVCVECAKSAGLKYTPLDLGSLLVYAEPQA